MREKVKSMVTQGLFLTAVLWVSSCSKEIESKKATPENDQSAVTTIQSSDQLNTVLESNQDKLLVFDLYADWCMPCKVLAPTFSSLADTHRETRFFRINVDQNPDIAAAFGVRGIPYVVFVKNKQAVYALTGLNPKEKYEQVITACGSPGSVTACQENLNKM